MVRIGLPKPESHGIRHLQVSDFIGKQAHSQGKIVGTVPLQKYPVVVIYHEGPPAGAIRPDDRCRQVKGGQVSPIEAPYA